jgi:predicted permease
MTSAIADWIQELSQAIRLHRRHAGAAAAVVVTLSLGIGASTSLFSVIEALFLRPLPYGNADRLVLVWEDASARGGNNTTNVSGANFLDWREGNTVFERMAAVRNTTRTLTSLRQPQSPLVHAVTANYFDAMGARALLGRTFARGEDAGQGAPVAMLSYSIWQSQFGGDPNIVGKTVDLDRVPHEIIGVMPSSFYSVNVFPTQPSVWIPLPIETFRQERGIRRFLIFAQLKDGVSLEQARSSMSALAASLAERYPATNERWSATVVPIREQLVGRVRGPLSLVGAGVVSLMLIGAFNVVCLVLASGAGRLKEMASRVALGAAPRRIVRQLLVETGLLAVAGAVLGFVASAYVTRYIVGLIPRGQIPFLDAATHDYGVAAFAGGSGIAIAVLCALITARQALRADVVAVVRQAGRLVTEGRVERRLRQGLVIAQVSLSVMLLLAAGLMAQSLRNLMTYPLGFDPANTITVNSALRGPQWSTAEARTRFFTEVLRRLEELPGVVSASAVNVVPPVSNIQTVVFSTDDRAAGAQEGAAALSIVQPKYFETMGIALMRGRTTTELDTAQSPRVMLISRELARRFFGETNPVGRTLVLDQISGKTRREIIGVVDDVRSVSPDPRARPVIYIPHSQAPDPDMAFVVRLAPGRSAPIAELRRIVLSIDPMLPVFDAQSMESIVANADRTARFVASLLSVFTLVGLVVVAAGLYGVLAFVVASREHEIGLRIALGARVSSIARIVLGFAMRLVGLGTLLGILAFAGVGSLLESLLFGVTRTDSATLIGVIAVVLTVALAVCVSPLKRALRVSPMDVIKTN